jgi:hypothetical protein
MVGENARRNVHLLVGAILAIGTPLIGSKLTSAESLLEVLGWYVLGVVATFFYLRWQLRSQVQSRSYGARRNLIEAPLRELDFDITPRVGWVRDPRLVEPEPISEKLAGIVAAFESAERRLLIVGEPGSGKTMAAYSLIEYLDKS